MKKAFSLFISLLLFWHSFGQIPAGYYDPAAGLSGQALQSALHNIIRNHNPQNYNSLTDWFELTDKKTDNTVWDMYSDVPGGNPPYTYYYSSGDECGSYNEEGDCFNKEHSWPKSWFGGEVMPMHSDLFHLYPTDGFVNNKRSNFPYGEVGQTDWVSENGSKLGNCSWPGYSGTVFEPIDSYKGDFARTYFYMSVRYYNEDNDWPGSPMTTGSQLKPWALEMMMQWHAQDPVSQKETNRNNKVYQIQDNRNPFIDHPEFADEIWGNGSAIGSLKGSERLKIYPNPAAEVCYIQLPEQAPATDSEVRLINISGEFIDCITGKENGRIRLETGSLPAGIYFVMIRGFVSGKQYAGLLIRI